MQVREPSFRSGSAKSAFTLVEMLVVIAIISILMTAGSIGLSGMGGKGVTSGVATAESLFDEARSAAVGRGLRSCVLVAKTLTNNPANDLRRIVVAYEPVDENGVPSTPAGQDPAWEISSRGILLPDQTFFSGILSSADHAAGSGAIKTVTLTDAKKSYQGEYYLYEFNAEGISTTPGASFVIGNGARNGGKSSVDAPPRVMGSAKRDFGGFVIWRNGRTSVFRTPDQISDNLPTPGNPNF